MRRWRRCRRRHRHSRFYRCRVVRSEMRPTPYRRKVFVPTLFEINKIKLGLEQTFCGGKVLDVSPTGKRDNGEAKMTMEMMTNITLTWVIHSHRHWLKAGVRRWRYSPELMKDMTEKDKRGRIPFISFDIIVLFLFISCLVYYSNEFFLFLLFYGDLSVVFFFFFFFVLTDCGLFPFSSSSSICASFSSAKHFFTKKMET